jgi:hypothetical protein
MLASMQRTFMYHPQRGTEQEFLAMAPAQKVEPWRDSQGRLIGWKRVLDKPATNRLLICMATAAMRFRAPISWMASQRSMVAKVGSSTRWSIQAMAGVVATPTNAKS